MNTATLHETTAIAGAVALEVADQTRNLILVPLSRLLPRRSKRNARTTRACPFPNWPRALPAWACCKTSSSSSPLTVSISKCWPATAV